MEKHRLELFSDGVFAIVLTLLVLDLKAPAAHGLAGVCEIAPALAVHALTFAIIGLSWIGHHSALAVVKEITTRTLRWNLLALFWMTLIPFGAKLAAERPLEALGPSLLSAAYALYWLSALRMRRSAIAEVDSDPLLQAWLREQYRVNYALASSFLICAALAWVWPAFGYVPMVAVIVLSFSPVVANYSEVPPHLQRADLMTDATS
jgi:uncharacterized membrane protein